MEEQSGYTCAEIFLLILTAEKYQTDESKSLWNA